MVGHTFLYSAPVQALRTLIDDGELGNLLYLYAQRLNLGARLRFGSRHQPCHSPLWLSFVAVIVKEW